MDPLTAAALVLMILLVTGGVWGWTIISELMKARTVRLRGRTEDPRVEALLESQERLESRLRQLEEEVGFFRELHGPGAAPGLSPGDGEGRDPDG